MDIHRLKTEEVYDELGSSEAGISTSEAYTRRQRYGPNEIQKKQTVPLWRKFMRQLTNFFALLLWTAAGMAILGEVLSPGEGMLNIGIALVIVVMINASFTFYQEYKAEKAVEALQQMLAYSAVVIRGGKEEEIPSGEVVPGDVIKLAEGNRVPADARLIESFELKVNNSILTGESEPQHRNAEVSELQHHIESENLVFSGTTVVSGSALGVVFATGMASEFGRIADLTSEIEQTVTPLQKEITKFIRVISVIAIILGIVFFATGLAIGKSFWVAFIFSIGIIVANVPEGLLPTVTLTLSIGSQRMARRNALIKSLNSVETLGSTTVICTDKTGTLTQNQMTVRSIYANGTAYDVTGEGYEPKGYIALDGEPVGEDVMDTLRELFCSSVFCNDSSLTRDDGEYGIIGDPTEGALKVLSAKACDMNDMEASAKRRFQIPFDSGRKRMSVVMDVGDDTYVYTKGAPESIIERCTDILENGKARVLDEQTRERIAVASREYADKALRVIALSYRKIDARDAYDMEETESGLTFIGLVGMIDPPRVEVKSAIEKCRSAGIRVVIITGDNPQTALAIARATGVVEGTDPEILAGAQIDSMDTEELERSLSKKEIIFARTTPEHKMKIVTALRDMGEVVAVTGDGVNDAPALKAADIGIAMGVSGTDVAKEASDMILVDDNFASIVNAVEEGRAVFENIRKFISYILTSNIPEIVPYIVYVLFGVPLPLTVLQILAVDLGTDLAPAIAIGAEPPEPGVMERKPRSKDERLLKRSTLLRSYGFVGPLEAAAGLLAFFWLLNEGGWVGGDLALSNPLYQKATTICLTSIIICQIANVFVVRSPRLSIFQQGFLSNKKILVGICIELVIILAIVYFPPMQAALGTQPLGAREWLFLIPFSVLLFVAEETRKYFVRRRESAAGN